MKKTALFSQLAYAAIVTLFISGAFSLGHSFWGINHLTYLTPTLALVAGGLLLVTSLIFYFGRHIPAISEVFNGLSLFIWNKWRWHRLIIVLFFGGLFFAYKLKIFFLGDGYTLLSVFGQGKAYLHKWTVPLSSGLIRVIQGYYGGYTFESAKFSFQLLSILSGIVCVYNLIETIGMLTLEPTKRIIGIATFVFSGSMLLFFGYVEFYPMVWATVSTFFHAAIRYLNGTVSIYWPVLAFLAALTIHLQTAMLVGGVFVLIMLKVNKISHFALMPRFKAIAATLFLTAGTGVLFIIKHYGPVSIVLPLVRQAEDPTGYSVLSLLHLTDIVNQLFLVFPGIAILLTWGIPNSQKDRISLFWLFCALGGLLWLVFLDPALGMARDWDLFSVAILPIGFYCFQKICTETVRITNNRAMGYLSLCLIVTLSFLLINFTSSSAENRFLDLLRRYGQKDYTGWSMLSFYYYNLGENEKSVEVAREMGSYFPVKGKLIDAQNELNINNPDKAIEIALELLPQEPKNRELLHLLAKAFKQKGNFRQSEKYYLETLKVHNHSRIANELGQLYMENGYFDQAINIFRSIHRNDPSLTNVMEGLGLAHFRKGDFHSALEIADSLFSEDTNSPGGHLLSMVVAIASGSKDEAKLHFNQFLRYGKGRSDYKSISEYYGYLNNP